MKKVAMVMLLVVVVSLAMAVPAFAMEGGGEMVPCESGEAFGLHHAGVAQNGVLDGDMNPGVHHAGYSHCLELGEG